MNFLVTLDQQLFLAINHLPHTLLLDTLAQIASGIGKAGMIWFVLGGLLFWREEKKNHWFFLPIILAGVGSWLVVEQLIKPAVSRLRPTLELGAIIVGNGSDGFSFPSGHATIAAAMAVILASYEPRLKRWFWALAIAISFSRIYLGVHYPLDVLVGGLLGWGLGKLSLRLTKLS